MSSAFIDCHEQQMQTPFDKTVARTVWSEYKQRNTLKFLGSICGNGAFTFCSDAYPGRITDPEITRISGFLDLIHKYGVTVADKGFFMHHDFSERSHKLLVPVKASKGQEFFSEDSMVMTAEIARKRIHVERAFQRAQEFKILHKIIPVTEIDIFGMIFKICCGLTNFQPPLIEDKDTNIADTTSVRSKPKKRARK